MRSSETTLSHIKGQGRHQYLRRAPPELVSERDVKKHRALTIDADATVASTFYSKGI